MFHKWKHRFDELGAEVLRDRYRDVASRPENLVHSHPATQRRSECGDGHQRLYRHETRRNPTNPRVFWISSEWLDEFAADALALQREMYALRVEG